MIASLNVPKEERPYFTVKGTKDYEIHYNGTLRRWTCTCKQFTFRCLDTSKSCKHIDFANNRYPDLFSLIPRIPAFCRRGLVSELISGNPPRLEDSDYGVLWTTITGDNSQIQGYSTREIYYKKRKGSDIPTEESRRENIQGDC